MRKVIAAGIAVALIAFATAAVGGAGGRSAAAATPSLQEFGTCAGFLRYVKRNAVRLAGPYGLGSPVATAAETGAADAASPPAPGGGTPGVDYSTTNVQEAGIDEPDIVKTDGRRIYAIAQSTLYVIDASGADTHVLGSLALENAWNAQLFVHGDRVFVLVTGGGVIPLTADILPFPQEAAITEIDVSDPASPVALRTYTIDGWLLAARLARSTMRVVAVSGGPSGIEFVGPGAPGVETEAAATSANQAAIQRSGVASWVPSYRLEDRRTGRVESGRVLDCRQIARPKRFSGLGMLTVLTFDLDRGLEPVDADGIFATGDTVYASAQSLYVATQRWVDWSKITDAGDVPSITTEIHAFDASVPGETAYRTSGSVPGFVLNQFALSEWDGFLRVATTTQPPWWGEQAGRSENRVTVLSAPTLSTVGQVAGLGKGERIYAVRFIGHTGYVVTFRQIDPLYVVDLSDPARPQVAGELELLGYSAYLHPLGDGLLLGVGQDSSPEGRPLGTQVSVFDVADPGHPVLLHRRALAPGWSEAEYDHHAFLWWPAAGLAVLPVQAMLFDESAQAWIDEGGAVGLHAGRDDLSEVGRVTHPAAQIRRSLVVGQTLYTVSDAGVKASALDGLADLAWASFVPAQSHA